jgi:chromosomal replication initiator protein
MMDRLITRFSCGVVTEMEKPNVQLCVDIQKRKIKRDGLHIPENVISYIAENANGSVREIQGIINSLMAYSIT